MVSDTTYLSASAVAHAGRDLHDALGDPARSALAQERLAGAAERSIAQFDQTATAAYQALAEQPSEQAPATEDLLAAALSQLEVANTLLAASHAIGEQGEQEPTALDRQLRQLGNSIDLLGSLDDQPLLRFQDDDTASSTVEDAAAALGGQTRATLDGITTRSADVMVTSVTIVHDGGPDALKKAWNWANENLHLDKIGGRLVKLGLRAFSAALQLLQKVFPGSELAKVRADVEQLIADMTPGRTVSTLVGAALGVRGVGQWAQDVLGRPGGECRLLDAGTGKLVALTAEHAKRMELWRGISTAIGVARTLTVAVRIVIPHLGLIIIGANLVVVGAVVTVGRTSTAGVRGIVAAATGQQP